MVNLKLKLKWLKTDLKKWNLEVFNKSKVRKKVSEIEDIDKKDDEGSLDKELRVRRFGFTK